MTPSAHLYSHFGPSGIRRLAISHLGDVKNVTADMTSVLNKLLDIVACGLGAVGGPLLAPWRARREAKARIIAAKADAAVLEIRVKACT